LTAGVPQATIVVPTFNRERLVGETIESVLAQDYPNVELLVLDDGSTDGTPDLLRDYAREHPGRFRFERHENMGQARTLNRGFEIARGDIVGYLNSDDLLLPGAISKLVDALESDPDAVGVYPAFQVIDEDGEVRQTMAPPEYSAALSLRVHHCIVFVGALFRRHVYDEIGGWDPSFTYLADFDWCLRASKLGAFRLVPEPLACWRQHGESYNAAPGLDAAREQLRLLDKVYGSDEVPAELDAVRDDAYRNAFYVAAFTMGGVNMPGERFYAVDTLVQDMAPDVPDQNLQLVADLQEHVEGLEARARVHAETLAASQLEIRRLRRELGPQPPRWWRALRGLTPSRLRPWGRRTFGRLVARRNARGGPRRP
jgi:glycosyltransferase involved in cell wall biosynthesis